MPLPEPVKVSPVIKLFRYGLLLAGIIYGASKYKVLRAIEAGRKEEKERKKAERDMHMAEEKRLESERDVANLVAIFSESKPKLKEQIADHGESCSFKEDKTNSEEACTFKEVENKPIDNPESTSDIFDVFVEKFEPTESKDDIPVIPRNNQEEDHKTPTVSTNEGEYFIETFQKVPYAAAPDNKVSDFLPKVE